MLNGHCHLCPLVLLASLNTIRHLRSKMAALAPGRTSGCLGSWPWASVLCAKTAQYNSHFCQQECVAPHVPLPCTLGPDHSLHGPDHLPKPMVLFFPPSLNLHSEVGRDGSEAIVAPWIILTHGVEQGEAEGAAPNTCTGPQAGKNAGWLQSSCLAVCIRIYNCTLPGAVRKV